VSKHRSTLIGIAAPLLFALLLLMAAPAAAHHKSWHEKGGGGSGGKGKAAKSGSGMTEDNDTNDNGTPNNVVDDGDNRHPSGKDKSVEHGNSGNQGNSSSDPDDDGRGPDRSNGGPDKPDGSGGVDLADQDGNNGCGNDDDFEDDNEGWCGKNPKAKGKSAEDSVRSEGRLKRQGDGTVTKDDVEEGEVDASGDACVDEASMTGIACKAISDALDLDVTAEDAAEGTLKVLGERVTRPAVAASTATDAATLGTDVADVADVAERRSSALPLTGSGVAKLLLAAGGLVLLGTLLLRAQRRT